MAGNGTSGYTGDGGAATAAELHQPDGLAVDNAGNIYIADHGNNRIRKVTAATGIISTVAGNGTAGYSGDGGAATSAELSGPGGLVVDAAGNIYIGDFGNNRIRKVNASTGIISTLAGNGTQGYSGDGGAATSAELNGPCGLALDSAANVYVADYGNNRVRKVTVSTGIISTVAGNGTAGYAGDGGAATSAELNQLVGVAIDTSGNIYVADYGNNRIRKVTVSTGVISTVAGNGTAGYSGDGGAATSGELNGPGDVAADAAGSIYVADIGNNRIRKVTASTGILSTVAGNGTAGFAGDGGTATSGELNQPDGVKLDSLGHMYISDLGNNRVRAVSPAGIVIPGTGLINTIAGNGTAGYSGDGGAATLADLYSPNGVVVDSAGNVYIVDASNNRVRKVNASSGIITTVAGNGTAGYSGDGGPGTNAQLNDPTGVAIDTSGNIYIAEYNNCRIRKVAATTGIITTVAGNGTAGYSGDGGQATSASLAYPQGVAVDASGNIYIADSSNNRIRKVTISTGIITTVAGNGTAGYSGDGAAATSAKLNEPFGPVIDASGNIYIPDLFNYRVRKVTVSTGIITTVAGNGTEGYTGDGGAATSAELNFPWSVAFDSAGNFYISDSNNARIRKVTISTGIITTVAGNGVRGYSGDGGVATSAELYNPYGVAVDSAANIYIADDGNSRIRVVGTSTTVTVASSVNPSTSGSSVSFTVTVRPSTSSGTATVKDGTTTLGTATITGGTGIFTTSTLAAGTHSITAVFSGGGTSPALVQTVGTASSTAVVSSLNPSTYNSTVTFTATVTPSAATGTVAFRDGNTTLGVAELSAGTAAYSTAALTAGLHYITAVYSGNPSYTGSTSSVLSQTVNLGGTSVAVASSLNPAIYGNRVSFSATVTPSTSTGTVTFLDDTLTLGTANLSGGTTAISTGALTAATTTISVVNWAQTYETAFATVGSASGFAIGNSITVSGVSNTFFDGTFTISSISGNVIGWNLVGGGNSASGTGGSISVGHPITAVYSGDANHSGSTSAVLTETVSANTVLPGAGIINTIAGTGTSGHTGDGGPATFAEVSPWGVALDSAGNVYFAEFSHNSVREINVTTGIITTVAGNGTAGYSGDGGPATAAELDEPQGVAVDSAGNIYISEYGDNRIRKVAASTGIITTVAGNGTAGYSGDGGQATSAELYSPYGVAVDSAGNFYIADANNHRIRKVTVSTGVITTVAGNGTSGYSGDDGAATSAEIEGPVAVALDPAGNIFICDQNNNRIRKVTVSTGIITTAAGNGTAGYSGDGGTATAAELNIPSSVAVDSADNIYISDTNNYRIRKVTAAGIITTVAGNGAQGYSGDGGPATSAEMFSSFGVAVDGAADIFLMDGNRIRVVGTATTTVTVASSLNPSTYGSQVNFTATVRPPSSSGTATFKDGATTLGTGTVLSGIGTYSTSALATGSHSITVTFSGGGTSPALVQTVGAASAVTLISSLNPSTYGTSVTFTATVTPSAAAGNVTFVDSGTTLGVVELSSGTAAYSTSALTAGAHSITAIYNGSPSYTGSTSSALSQTVNPASTSVAVASSLNPAIYGNPVNFTATVTPSSATGTVAFMDDTGTLATVAVSGGTAAYSATALAAGTHSITAVYSGDAEHNGSTSTVLTEIVSTKTILPAAGIINTIAGNGTSGYSGDGGPATLAELKTPGGVAVDAGGNLYIADASNSRLREVNVSSGLIATVAGNGTAGYSGDGGPATAAELKYANGVALDAASNIYILDAGNNRVRKVTVSTGIITTVAGNGTAGYSGDGGQATSAELNTPNGLALDTAGNIYIADNGNNRVRKVTVSTGVITTVAGNGTGGYTGDGGAATSAELDQPWAVAVDSAGNIYIADIDNNRIRKVTVATGIITTVAGNGTSGYSGDGGAATSAELDEVSGVAVDAANNIYIADEFNQRIRKVTVSTGIITTVAGNGTAGYTGDGGPAVSAELHYPGSVGLDIAGNIYIADGSNYRVRVVGTTSSTVAVASSLNPSTLGNTVSFTVTVQPPTSSGTATFKDGTTTLGTASVSGGTGTYSTSALAVGAHSITAVFSGGGTSPALVQTVGTASAVTEVSSLNPSTYGSTVTFTATVTPSAAPGVVTFLDGSTTLGAVELSGGVAAYSTAALGAGLHSITAVYSGDPSYTGSSSSVLNQTVTILSTSVTVASSLNPAIYGNKINFTATVTPSTAIGSVTFMDGTTTLGTSTVSGGIATYSTTALAAGTHSITAVYTGNANDGQSTSSVLTETISTAMIPPAAGIINTIAGTGATGYTGDGGAATLTAVSPGGVAVDTAGNVYIADSGNYRIRKLTASTGIISTVAGNGVSGYSGDGGQATSAEVNSSYPWGVSVDGSGNIYIADYLTCRIRKVTASTGVITTVAGNGNHGYSGDGGQATSATLATPYVVKVDSAGNIYIADYNNNRIRKVTASTGIISTVAGNGTAGYSGDGGAATSAELNTPIGVGIDSAGNIYIADTMNYRVRKVTVATGIITTLAGTGTSGYSGDGGLATAAKLSFVDNVGVDTAGNVYIADASNERIRRVSAATGIITTVAGNGNGGYTGDGGPATSATLYAPSDVALDTAGNFYIADSSNRRVRVVGTTKTSTTGGSSLNPSGFGSPVTFTATVSPAAATGTVTFKDGTTTLGTGTLSGGTASYNTSTLAVGSHSITAVYSGDSTYAGSTSAVLTQKIETASSITVASSLNPSSYTNSVTFTATVTPSAATGTVTFLDGTTTLGAVALSSGTAAYSTSTLVPGTHSITAQYGGNATYAAAVSSVLVQTVTNPTIQYISPPAAAVGNPVNIVGQYFGSSNGTVKFNNTAATSIGGWSAGSITVNVPTGATTGNVVVTAASGLVSNSFPFTVTSIPSITSLSVTSGVPGQSVTISGANFGPAQGTSEVLFNGAPAATTSWNANGMSIVALVPANASTGPVVVVVNGVQSNGITFTDTAAPVIQNISPPSGTGTTSVTINGTSFGASQSAVSGTVTFNGQPATPTSWIATKIVVPAPAGVTTGNVVVTANGIASNGVQFVAAPIIASLTPTSGGVGTGVTIAGTNFGSTGTVTFNGQTATPLSWNPSAIVVPVPSTTTGNVVVTVGGVASNAISFTVTAAPGISSISPTTARVGTPMTIHGSGFGATQGSNSTVTFNGVVATPTLWNANEIQAAVPQNGVPGPVVVNVNGVNSNMFNVLAFLTAPTITGLSLPGGTLLQTMQGPPQMGFQITGTNFDPSGNNFVTFGNTQLPILNTTINANNIVLTVQVPVGAAPGAWNIVVTAGLAPENGQSAPVVFTVVPPLGCAHP